MDALTALILTAVGLVLLWVLIIRKRLVDDLHLDPTGSFAIESNTQKAGEKGLLYSYSAAWTTGRRDYMEDRHIACAAELKVGQGKRARQKPASLYGVFDGHGGSRAADFCCDNMQKLFAKAVDVVSNMEQDDDASDAVVAFATLHKAMCLLDTEFLEIAEQRRIPDGTTAVVALSHGDQLVVGNIGKCFVGSPLCNHILLTVPTRRRFEGRPGHNGG